MDSIAYVTIISGCSYKTGLHKRRRFLSFTHVVFCVITLSCLIIIAISLQFRITCVATTVIFDFFFPIYLFVLRLTTIYQSACSCSRNRAKLTKRNFFLQNGENNIISLWRQILRRRWWSWHKRQNGIKEHSELPAAVGCAFVAFYDWKRK